MVVTHEFGRLAIGRALEQNDSIGHRSIALLNRPSVSDN
jgi:hypothetical protein